MKGDSLGLQFTILGFACLIGFNVLMQAGVSIPSTSFSASNLQFGGDGALVYGGAMNLTLILLSVWGNGMSNSRKAVVGGILMSLGLIYVSFASMVNLPRYTGYIGMILLGMGTSVFQGMVMGLAGQHSQKAMSNVSTGQALSGLICMPLALLLNLAKSNQITVQSLILFGAISILGSIPIFLNDVAPHSSVLALSAASLSDEEGEKGRSIFAVLKDTWRFTLLIWINFFLLFTVFNFHFTWFVGGSLKFTMMLFIFNLADFLGRLSVSFGVRLSPRGIYAVTLFRLIPFLGYLLCTYSKYAMFHMTAVRYLVVALLLLAQGPAVTWCFILSPSKLDRAADHKTLGTVNTFAVVNGIFLGSIFGLLLSGVLPAPMAAVV